ncbi:MAG TPA: hypothetical protein EYG88_01925 [Desulfocapsa sulfexigens]|nr:hypothetical protein [Desulfocapsa sulfexigens]
MAYFRQLHHFCGKYTDSEETIHPHGCGEHLRVSLGIPAITAQTALQVGVSIGDKPFEAGYDEFELWRNMIY